MALCAITLFINDSTNSYMKALTITCFLVALIPLFIGYPLESVYENHKKINNEGSYYSAFMHNNLIYIFVGSTFVISQLFLILE